jgi:hypothetical protein
MVQVYSKRQTMPFKKVHAAPVGEFTDEEEYPVDDGELVRGMRVGDEFC